MTRVMMALVVLALAWPAAAHAQSTQTKAPPGNSAIDEYRENAPGAGGSTLPRPPGDRGVLSPAKRADLERLGADGRTLADAVDATAPATKPRELNTSESDGRSPFGEVLDAAGGNDGGSGMGLLLPAILIAALLAAITLVALRRRAAS